MGFLKFKIGWGSPKVSWSGCGSTSQLSLCRTPAPSSSLGFCTPRGRRRWAPAFYSINPYALALISRGQLTVGVGYALFP